MSNVGGTHVSGMMLLRWLGKEGGWELHDHAYMYAMEDVESDDDPMYESIIEHLNQEKPVVALDDVIRIVFIGRYSWSAYDDSLDEFFDIEAIHWYKLKTDELNRFYEQLEIDEDLREQERAEEDAS